MFIIISMFYFCYLSLIPFLWLCHCHCRCHWLYYCYFHIPLLPLMIFAITPLLLHFLLILRFIAASSAYYAITLSILIRCHYFIITLAITFRLASLLSLFFSPLTLNKVTLYYDIFWYFMAAIIDYDVFFVIFIAFFIAIAISFRWLLMPPFRYAIATPHITIDYCWYHCHWLTPLILIQYWYDTITCRSLLRCHIISTILYYDYAIDIKPLIYAATQIAADTPPQLRYCRFFISCHYRPLLFAMILAFSLRFRHYA